MFLHLSHKKLEVYPIIKELILELYKITSSFPAQEKFGLASQLQRAAVSILLNLAEGSARKSLAESVRFYEIARASLVELDAGLELVEALYMIDTKTPTKLENLVVDTFKKLTLLIKVNREGLS